jgi:hypothetical protein
LTTHEGSGQVKNLTFFYVAIVAAITGHNDLQCLNESGCTLFFIGQTTQ